LTSFANATLTSSNHNKLNTMTTKRTKRKPTQLDRIEALLNKVEASVAVIRSGATFMQQLEQDVAAMEAAKTPKFGDRVEYQDDMGWKIAMDVATPDGIWTIVKSGHPRMAWAKRHEFRIIS
jgi:hypothetical protein